MSFLGDISRAQYDEMRQIMGDRLYHDVMVAVSIPAVDDIATAIYDATSRTAKTVQAFAQAVNRGVKGLSPELAEAHRQIALNAQEAIITSYEDSLLGTPSYRVDPIHEQNKRYAGGILLAILREADFCQSDENGVYIGNTEALDRGARQWRRLNYGAGAAAGGGAAVVTAHWSNIDITLEEPGSRRPGFGLPGGRWIGREFYPYSELEGLDEYLRNAMNLRATPKTNRRRGAYQLPSRMYREGRGQRRETRGIRGQHWMAAGLRVVADSIGPAYSNVFKKLWTEGDEAARAALAGDTGLRRPGTPGSYTTQQGGFSGRQSAGE